MKLCGKIRKIIVSGILCVALLAGCGLDGGYFTNIPTQKPVTQPVETTAPAATEAYTDTPIYKEHQLYADAPTNISVTLGSGSCDAFLEALDTEVSDFRMADYYRLDDALTLYGETSVEKSTETDLLVGGQLDVEKLYRQVLENNAAVTVNGRITLNPFFSALEEEKIYEICQAIARVINSKTGEIDIRKVANTLERLTVFTRSGSTSNAYVSSELAFVYNPNMIDLYTRQQEILGGSPETVWEQVIVHEIMHLIQHGANDGNDGNGVEIGICRMYNLPNADKTLLVDSLYNTWILEAGAELAMTEVVGVAPGTYQKKISYSRSYNLSRFYELQTGRSMLEKAAFSHTLEDAYNALGLYSEEMQLEFLKFLYSVEITQMDPEDFWASYEAENGSLPDAEEQLGIRMSIRTDAVTYMTRNFFANMAHGVRDGVIRDLDTVFYMLRLWELDVFGHLAYTELSSLEYAKDFLVWYDGIQREFLNQIAQSSDLDPAQVLELYDAYCLRILDAEGEAMENCDLSLVNTPMQLYILSARENYATAKFSRVRDVVLWLADNEE